MNMEGKDHARDFKMQEANGLTNGFNSLDVVSPSPSLSQEEYRHSSLSDARKDVGTLKVLESKGARTTEEDILMNEKKTRCHFAVHNSKLENVIRWRRRCVLQV
jgi:hypothetical protein